MKSSCLTLLGVLSVCAIGVPRGVAGHDDTIHVENRTPARPAFIEPGEPAVLERVVDGTRVRHEFPTETVWRPMCGSDASRITEAELRHLAEASHATGAGGTATATGGAGGSRFDLVINPMSEWPPGAAEALAAIERYFETRFTDPVQVTLNVGFAPLSGILGTTGVSYVNVSWLEAGNSLRGDMDSTDTIQDFLPDGLTVPVRYDATSSTVTDTSSVHIPAAALRALGWTSSGPAATLTFNSNTAWGYDPTSLAVNQFSFRDVAAHEIAHALGFTSAVDTRTFAIELMDVYRFQMSDPLYNPTTLEEFRTMPRTVDRNPPSPVPDGDVVSDLVAAEYRMSDGSPYQASHFFAESPSVYLMDPTFVAQETFHPSYLQEADAAMLDAVGWDYPPENFSCDAALPLDCGVRHVDTGLVGGVPDPPFGCGLGSEHDGAAWFWFTATSNAARISTCASEGPDSTLAVYEGACGGLVEIACSEDDGCASPGLSQVCLNDLVVGQTYYVQVAARTTNDLGIYSLELECSCDAICSEVCCETAAPPEPDEGSVDRNRYVSFIPTNPGVRTALRVTFVRLLDPMPPAPNGDQPDFSEFEGQIRWAGPPETFVDTTIPATEFRASKLQCEPYFRDWSTEELLFITGASIVPSSEYTIQAVDERCMSAGAGEPGFSAPLVVSTARWGDLAPPYQDPLAGTPSEPSVLDVSATVDKLKGLATAPPRDRAQLQPRDPQADTPINVSDIGMAVDALKSLPYPYTGPDPCP